MADPQDAWNEARKQLDEIYSRVGYRFRGQSNSAWEIQPSLARQCQRLNEVQLRQIELAFANDFARACHAELPKAPPFKPESSTNSMLAWWIYMQHYGSPTRLLDWTQSPYVATYFAVAADWDCDGAVWYFDRNGLSSANSTEFCAIDWRAPPQTIDVYDFHPQLPTNRILAQKGTFTVCCSGLASHGNGLDRFGLGKVIVPAFAKPHILRALLSMNVSANVLFPGLDGMGQELQARLKLLLSQAS